MVDLRYRARAYRPSMRQKSAGRWRLASTQADLTNRVLAKE